jgi:hypothetical protein
MTTVREDLEELLGYRQVHSEDEQTYIERVAHAANELSEAQWAKLQDKTQEWVNSVLMIIGKNQGASDKEKQPLPSFPDGSKKGVKSEADSAGDDGEKASEEAPEEGTEEEERKPPKAAAKKQEPKAAKPKSPPKSAPAKTEEPAVSRKSSKTRVSPKAASAARPSKSGGKGRGRPSKFAVDGKIKVLAKENPFREGSHNYKVFGLYKDGMTVSEFETAFNKKKGQWKGKVPMFLRYHAAQGAIKVVG